MKTSIHRQLVPILILGLLGQVSLFAQECSPALRSAQEQLQSQGYYFGPVDGKSGEQTLQAIRRYQIRNGLAVTGELDEATQNALRSGNNAPVLPTPPQSQNNPALLINPPSPPTPNPPSQDPVVQDRQFLQDSSNSAPPDIIFTPAPPRSANAPAPRPQPNPPRQTRQATPDAVTQDAQAVLSQAGYYRGQIDGLNGPATRSAILAFQQDSGLRATGRLDDPTLATLGLVGGAPNEEIALRAIPVTRGWGGNAYPVALPVQTGVVFAEPVFFRPVINFGVSFNSGGCYVRPRRYYGGGGGVIIVR